MIADLASPPKFRRLMAAKLLVFAAVIVGGCAPPEYGSGSGPGRRRQILGLSPQDEYRLGVKAYRQILDKARAEGRLVPKNDRAVRRVGSVGNRIVKAVGIEPLQREINLNLRGYRFDWEFNVIKSRQINAFCLPGGKVVVFTGLMEIVEDESQLATVLSHEIAHALAHHSNERITTEESGRVGWLANLAYDRAQESEADHIGLFLMTFADFDPDEALVFWQRMQRAARGGQLPEILSNHPSDARRIQQLRRWIPQAKAAKDAFEHQRIAPAR